MGCGEMPSAWPLLGDEGAVLEARLGWPSRMGPDDRRGSAYVAGTEWFVRRNGREDLVGQWDGTNHVGVHCFALGRSLALYWIRDSSRLNQHINEISKSLTRSKSSLISNVSVRRQSNQTSSLLARYNQLLFRHREV